MEALSCVPFFSPCPRRPWPFRRPSPSRRRAPKRSRVITETAIYYGPTWQGEDGRYYCRRPNGTTGLIVGGAAGALIGRQIDGGRSRTTGTILGAAAGALIGREIQRSSSGRRCR